MLRSILFAGLAAVGFLVPTTGTWAQEELPAPGDAPAPPRSPAVTPRSPPVAPRRPLLDPRRTAADPRANLRAERRERLRNLGGQVLDVLAPPDGAASPLDIPKLNSALAPLLRALLGGGDNIESLRIGFDPQGTNFAEDRLKLDVDAALRRTAWAETPSRLSGTLGAQVTRDDSGGLAALLEARLRMQTPTVALANYALTRYKQRDKGSAGDQPPAPASADDLFAQMLDEKLARVERLESLDDVADLLTSISGLRLTAMSQTIEGLRDQARAATDADARQDLERQLAQARLERDKLFDVRPRIERGSNGAVSVISLDMVGSELFPGAEMRKMDFRLTENEITVSATGALTRWVEIYPVVKPLVMGVLTRIQNGDPRALDGVRPFLDGAIGRGRAMIIGEP